MRHWYRSTSGAFKFFFGFLLATAVTVSAQRYEAGALVVRVLDGNITADIGTSIPAGSNNIGVVGLAAGTNNVGDVDVLTVPAPLSTTGGGTEAAAQRVTLANDSTGEVRIADDAGNQIASATTAPAAAARGLIVRQPGPCKNENKSIAVIDVVTATTTLVVTGVGGQHVYICSVALVTAGANNVALVAGTGATCGTSTAGMNGGITAAEGWNFAANGGIAHGSGDATVLSTNVTGGAVGDSVCIITSAAVQLSGTISYVVE